MNTNTFSRDDGAHFTPDTISDARTRQGDHCARCGVHLNTVTSYAHALEKQDPPRDEVGNCFVLCDTCDYLKSFGGGGGGSVETRTVYGFWEASRGGTTRGARTGAAGVVVGGHRAR